MKNILFLDLGNSLLKIGYFNNKNELIIDKLPTKSLTKWNFNKYFKNLIAKGYTFNNALLSSVNYDKSKVVQKVLKKHKVNLQNINHEMFKNELYGHGEITLDEVGADILLTSYYMAKNYYSGFVVSFGTATVITKIENKTLKGVIIAPGIKNSMESLFSNAFLLNQVELNYELSDILATNTKDAISSGIIKGNYFMIQGFLNALNHDNSPVLFTGGNLSFLKNEITVNIVEEMVIKSMILLYENLNK
ncbi:type III pantothenate kinase [Mycoplasmopsis edwardii]|uniref:Type III pantothenate kinase n=1 Tax=Mycoplasmopsis edwardii TaxID=53558 RepID=A0ACD4PHY5_9BACT|nr:type III pantothenate kinase [Mycoplasmopsis edwardii]WBP84284.1 type III pantothenate kinase [Mycoplasmopsis edwardii]